MVTTEHPRRLATGLIQTVPPTRDADAVHATLRAHLEAVAEYWPGLARSLAADQVTYCAYQAGTGDVGAILGALVDTAEDLRHRRNADGDLECTVMAVSGPHLAYAPEDVLNGPLWIANNLYAPAGLIVHLAVAGDVYDSIPDVPVSFYLVRPWSAAWHLDDADEPDVVPASVDDGRDVLMSVIGKRTSPEAARTHFPSLLLRYRRS